MTPASQTNVHNGGQRMLNKKNINFINSNSNTDTELYSSFSQPDKNMISGHLYILMQKISWAHRFFLWCDRFYSRSLLYGDQLLRTRNNLLLWLERQKSATRLSAACCSPGDISDLEYRLYWYTLCLRKSGQRAHWFCRFCFCLLLTFLCCFILTYVNVLKHTSVIPPLFIGMDTGFQKYDKRQVKKN